MDYNSSAKINGRFVFMTEKQYLIHVGNHYEEKILEAKKNLEPVIRIRNINGTVCALPLDRAVALLDKYYHLTKSKKPVVDNNIVPIEKGSSKKLSPQSVKSSSAVSKKTA